MDLLLPIIKPYAWGSREALARLQGRTTPAAGPEAELWMGAHPSGPAGLTRDGRATTLLDVVTDDPHAELGTECAERFGGRLPFLLKVLAAEQPLSIQVHPDQEQARAGFAAQASDGGRGPYVDDWPKPELLYALTRFEVLAGFRDREEAARLLRGLEVEALRPVIGLLHAGTDERALSAALRALLEWPPEARADLVHSVVSSCRRAAGSTGPAAAAYGAVVRMSRHHPGDLGLVASLLLDHRVLEPGEALFMPAGGLHAYVHGVGLELLANSDNVLRAGLTTKEVNVPELLRITNPAVRVPAVMPTRVQGPGSTWLYDCPAAEFALYRTDLDGSRIPLVPAAGPRIAFCLDGSASLRATAAGSTPVRLGPGTSCFLPDSDGEALVEGNGTLFVATVGRRPDRRDTPAQPSVPLI
ncbi:mannose-6-phosphate isomerase, class I [Streptomyces sp. S1A]|uniref:mannose-6-phosphate isomerase, class I n=1 Tax=Streptomyces sp. ICN903 TaxID=2964654 RepID=UPI001EDB71C8|nr:mannose-6-phosphate isomerase, class I [Streptomyces sp. ICN903]MCG3039750.1 mannose-6-phosphate isomerase, class I [Streptomyces sp. ICN903]